MYRRTYLALAGSTLVGAGCLGPSVGSRDAADGGGNGSGSTDSTTTARDEATPDRLPVDEQPRDGYPPAFGATPTERPVDAGAFETTTVKGTEVPLAPIEATYYWYRRRGARFVDARGTGQYERAHVYGAVSSPAPDGRDNGDPVSDWPAADRIVCYCGCPHHLSSLRAATLIDEGYERVFVVDEGFWEWHDRGYPMAGSEFEDQPALRVVRGRTASEHAGKTAWARHGSTGQQEATVIDADGHYELELRFAGVDPDSTVAVETPAYRVVAPLADLTGRLVTGADASGR